MEQNEVEKIHEEVEKKIKLTKEQKYKIYGKMFKNLLLALGVLIYFVFLNLGYLKLETEVFKTDLKIFAAMLLGFTIYFIEKAYKTKRGTFAVHAIELLVISVITLYMPYVYFYHNKIAQFLFTTSSAYIAIYYMVKCIFIYVIYKNRYIKQASDVTDILKEENISYLDEKSSKKFENNDDIKENAKKKTTKKSKKTSEKKENIETEKIEKEDKIKINEKTISEEKIENTKKTTAKTKSTAKKTTGKTSTKTTKKTTKSTTAKKNIEDNKSEEKTKTTRGRKSKMQAEEVVVEEKQKAKRGRKPKTEAEKVDITKKTTTKKTTPKKTTTKKKTTKKAETEKE